MSRPTPTALALAKSTLPVRRVASPSPSAQGSPFATLLQKATAPSTRLSLPASTAGGPAPLTRSEMLATAAKLLHMPYAWGGNSTTGLDCSAFVSKVWGVPRQTTDTLASVAQPIGKDDLRAGDALNLTTARDADGSGHIRLFDRWANATKTKMYVYEETPPRSVYHAIDWDPSYTPMRRLNTIDA